MWPGILSASTGRITRLKKEMSSLTNYYISFFFDELFCSNMNKLKRRFFTMKQDRGYQITSNIIAKQETDSPNTMRLTTDMDRMQPVANKDMSKINSKVKTPDKIIEEPKDIVKAIK